MDKNNAPFIDATGSKAGALLGDVKHDPLQSGGMGTPAHLRIEAGAVHRANKGVLFIDEIGILEKSEKGFFPEIQEVLNKKRKNNIFIIRKEVLSWFIDRFAQNNFKIFDLQSKDSQKNYQIVLKYIQEDLL